MTELSGPELARLLAPFDLRPRRVQPLAAGTINSNYRVDSDGGPLFVRVNEGKTEAEVRYEADLLWWLGVRRYPTPQPLRCGHGAPFARHADKIVSVFPWQPGAAPDESAITPGHAAAVGRALATLHVAARDFPGRRRGRYTREQINRRLAALRDEPRVAALLPGLEAEAAFVRAAQVPLLPLGTMHGDLFPDNTLFRGEALLAVLDFEQAAFGRLVYDVAVALLAWCWQGERVDEIRARALTSAYAAVRPFEPSEREGLYAEARFAALRFTVTRISDVLLPGLDRPGKDYRDYLARAEFLRACGAETVAAWLA